MFESGDSQDPGPVLKKERKTLLRIAYDWNMMLARLMGFSKSEAALIVARAMRSAVKKDRERYE